MLCSNALSGLKSHVIHSLNSVVDQFVLAREKELREKEWKMKKEGRKGRREGSFCFT